MIIDKKTLCIGLQHILMHISSYSAEKGDAYIEVIKNQGKQKCELTLFYRPYLFEFLEFVSKEYELIAYSILDSHDLNAIIDCLEKNKKYFSYRFHDQFCVFSNINYGIKSLDFLFGNRSLNDIILVGDTIKTLPLNIDNFVPIPPFTTQNDQDNELLKLASFLDLLYKQRDIRIGIKYYREENNK